MNGTGPSSNGSAATPVRTRGEGHVGRLLTMTGVFGSLILLVVAVAEVAGRRHDPEPQSFRIADVAAGVAHGRPESIAALGFLILVATPILRMLWIAAMLAATKRTAFALFSLATTALVILSIAVSGLGR